MGAMGFNVIKVGRYNTAQQAFNEAVEDAAYEHGHGGYTGTIAEKNTFRMIDCPPKHNPYKLADKIQEDYDHWVQDKWGPAGCIEINGAFLKRVKERYGYKGKKNIRAFIFFGIASS